MNMRVTKKEIICEERDVLVDVLCNSCGESCLNDIGDFNGLIDAIITCGYGSLIEDDTKYTFSICESCLKKMFDTFKIGPSKTDLHDYDYDIEPCDD